MKIDIVSVFPDYFDSLRLSLLGKAQDSGIVDLQTHDLRQWTHDVHRSVDDTPVGGGAGMVMKPEVWAECLDELIGGTPGDLSSSGELSGSSGELSGSVLIFPNPAAPLFNQEQANDLSRKERIIFGCGRYEGYDARIPTYYRERGLDVREYSIGDYVLNGGEAAVSVMVEAITRLIPGFMGNPDSIVEESYSGAEGLLEYQQYTKPAQWRGLEVPSVLLSGDHAKVNRFRRDDSLTKTARIRPDIIERLECSALDKADCKILGDLGWNLSGLHPRKSQEL